MDRLVGGKESLQDRSDKESMRKGGGAGIARDSLRSKESLQDRFDKTCQRAGKASDPTAGWSQQFYTKGKGRAREEGWRILRILG